MTAPCIAIPSVIPQHIRERHSLDVEARSRNQIVVKDAPPEDDKEGMRLFLLMPQCWRLVVSAVLYSTCTLAVDYAGTILDECGRLRLEGMKKQCRSLRKLIDDYSKSRQFFIHSDDVEKETAVALGIEDACSKTLSAINEAAKKIATEKGVGEIKYLLSAIAQCTAVTSALLSYAILLDGKVKDIFRIPVKVPHMFLPLEMETLHRDVIRMMRPDVWESLKPFLYEATSEITETMVGCEINGMERVRSAKFRKWTKTEERFVMLPHKDFTDAQLALCIGRSEKAFVKKKKELSAIK